MNWQAALPHVLWAVVALSGSGLTASQVGSSGEKSSQSVAVNLSAVIVGLQGDLNACEAGVEPALPEARSPVDPWAVAWWWSPQ